MTVGEFLPRVKRAEEVFQNLQKLERLLKNDPTLDESISDKADMGVSAAKVLEECRMRMCDTIDAMQHRINRAVLPEGE